MPSYFPVRWPIPATTASYGPAWKPYGFDDVVPPGPIFCAPLTWGIVAVEGGSNQPVFSTPPPNTITFSSSGGPFFQTLIQSFEEFEIGSNKLWAEITVDSATITNGLIGVAFLLTGTDGAFILFGTQANDGTVSAFSAIQGFPPFPGLDPSLENINIDPNGYTFQLLADGSTGDLYFFNGGIPYLIGNFPTLGSGARSIQVLGISGQGGADVIQVTVNAGYALPIITPPIDYVSWCNFPPPPPPDLPIFVDVPIFNNPDLNVVESNGNYVITNLAGVSEAFILQSEWHYCTFTGVNVLAEITVNSVSDTDLVTPTTIQFGYGHGALGGLEGIAILLGSVDGVTTDGALVDLGTQTGLVGNQAFPQGYTVQIRLDSLGQMSYVDTLGNSGNIGVNLLADQPALFLLVAQTPNTVNGSIDFTLRTNPASTVIPAPVGYVNVTTVGECYNAYRVFDFSSEGDVTLGAPFRGNLPRGFTMVKDGITAPEFTGSTGSAAFTFIQNYNGNLFELQCVSKDNADMNDKIVRIGTNAFLDSQMEICHSDGFGGIDGIDGTENAWAMRTFDGIATPVSLMPLFNYVPFVAGDTMAMAITTAGVSEDNVSVQFVLNVGGEQIVYDPVYNLAPDAAGLTFTPIIELKTSAVSPALDQASYQVNGISADYLNTYPDDRGFTDILEGELITNTVVAPRQALLAPFAWTSGAFSSASIDPTKKLLNINGVGALAPLSAYAHCPLAISARTGAYLIEMEIGGVVTSVNDYYLELRSPNSKETISVRTIGGDLWLSTYWDAGGNNYVTTNYGPLVAAYTPQAGDKFAILIQTSSPNPPSQSKSVTGIFQRGVDPIQSANTTTFYQVSQEFQDFFVFMGHGAVPIGEVADISSRLKSADMTTDIKNWVNTNKPVWYGTVYDLEGGAI